jgi:hypothetical protein
LRRPMPSLSPSADPRRVASAAAHRPPPPEVSEPFRASFVGAANLHAEITSMLRTFAGCAGLTALAFTFPAHAHHPSGVSSTGDAGPIATLSATTLARGQSAAAVFLEMVRIDAFSDTELKGYAARHIHAHSIDSILAPTLAYAYGVTDNVTLMLRLPVVMRTGVREGEHSHGPAGNTVADRGDPAGIGDLTVMGQIRVLNDRASGTEVAVLGGVKAPTGRTRETDEAGVRFESEFQPGSGSWDGLLGAAITKRWGAWSFDSNVLYQFVTEGAQHTDLGDRFLYNVALSYRMLGGPAGETRRMNLGALPEPMYHGGPKGRTHEHVELPRTLGPALDLVFELNGEWHGKERTDGIVEKNSGGNVVYASPGVRLSKDNWSSFVSVGVPVINQSGGVQAEPSWRLLTGVAVGF